MAPHDLTEELYAHVAEWATYPGYTELDRTGIEYAEKFCLDSTSIDQVMMDRLRAHLSDAQIVDLTYSVASWMGLGRVLAVMQVESSCALRI